MLRAPLGLRLTLSFATLAAVFCVWTTLSAQQQLQARWQQLKRQQHADSARLRAAIADQQRFAQRRSSYAALLENIDRYSHSQFSLLNYLQRLNDEVTPFNQAFSIAPARVLDDRGAAPAKVADITLSADFRHEDHLLEYLWHIDRQQSALLQVAAIDVDLLPGRDALDASANLQARILLHWYSLDAIGDEQ